MAAILKLWREIKIRQWMHIYLKNNTAKFHSDPIWNNRAFGEGCPNKNKKKKNKMSSDRSVPDL